MKTQLKAGDSAPPIQLTDLWGKAVGIPVYDRWIFLSFHRFAACPFCNLRVNELIRHFEQFEERNIEIITVWPSEEELLLRYVGNVRAPFSIVSNKSKSIYKAYGVTETSWSGAIRLMLHPQLIVTAIKNKHKNITVDADPNLMPASFLINPTGKIELAHYGKHFGDHPKIASILSSANA